MNIQTMNGAAVLVDMVAMARMLQISDRHLRNLVKDGIIPVIRLGKSIRFNPDAVMSAIQSHQPKE